MTPKLKSLIARTAMGLVAALALVFVAAIAAQYLSARGGWDADHAELWILGPFAVVAMIGAYGVGVAWMRSIDEAAREAHKSAWYWGGTAGMAVGGVPLILSSLPQATAIDLPVLYGQASPAAYAATGAFAMMMLMLIGYMVVWTWWWLRRR
jgi:hypothetical protein